jgi:hypothetical protein
LLNKIDLLIEEKRGELRILETEMYEALRFPGDRDYEYAALLYPLIGGLRQEIVQLEALALRSDPPSGEGFEARVWQLLTGPYRSLEIWISIRDYDSSQTTLLFEMRKLKARHTVSCTLRVAECIERRLHYDYAASLQHIGWQMMRGGKVFRRKAVLRNYGDLETLCQWMSVTMLEPFAGIWQYGEGQYYRFTRE